MRTYGLGERFYLLTEGSQVGELQKSIYLLSIEEFQEKRLNIPHKNNILRYISDMEYCKAELFGSCILGTICMPVRQEKIERKIRFGFYMQEGEMYLIGKEKQLIGLLGRMHENIYPAGMTTPGFFCRLLNFWLEEDDTYLQQTEKSLYRMEEIVLRSAPVDFYETITRYRRDLMILHAYYTQMQSMAAAIRSNTNQMLLEEECQDYTRLSDRIQNLRAHVEHLRDFVIQIRELYQAHQDTRQSNSMNLLTVLNAIFLPLTLLAGWYGMNFEQMPELEWEHGYVGAAVLSGIIILTEVIIFKKKGLL